MTAPDRTTVLFVCSGNICRSPYAEARARSALDLDRFSVASAGTIATPGLAATDLMQEVGRERGLDLAGHRARRLSDVPQPDWVIGMELHHLVSARSAFPDLPADRIRLLDHPNAVADPYGRSREVYESTADHIDTALERFTVVLEDR
jgi:protein-tyrosine phosphatase